MLYRGKGNFVRVALGLIEPVKKFKCIRTDNMWHEYENKPVHAYFSSYRNLAKIGGPKGISYLTLATDEGISKDLSPIEAFEACYVGLSIPAMDCLTIDTKQNDFFADSDKLNLKELFNLIEMDLPNNKELIALPLGVVLDKLKIKVRASGDGVILETEDKTLLGNPLYMIPAMMTAEVISSRIAKQYVDIICDKESASDFIRDELQKSVNKNDESGESWMDMTDNETLVKAVDALRDCPVIFHIQFISSTRWR